MEYGVYASAKLHHVAYTPPLMRALVRHHVHDASIMDCCNVIWGLAVTSNHIEVPEAGVAAYQARIKTLLADLPQLAASPEVELATDDDASSTAKRGMEGCNRQTTFAGGAARGAGVRDSPERSPELLQAISADVQHAGPPPKKGHIAAPLLGRPESNGESNGEVLLPTRAASSFPPLLVANDAVVHAGSRASSVACSALEQRDDHTSAVETRNSQRHGQSEQLHSSRVAQQPERSVSSARASSHPHKHQRAQAALISVREHVHRRPWLLPTLAWSLAELKATGHDVDPSIVSFILVYVECAPFFTRPPPFRCHRMPDFLSAVHEFPPSCTDKLPAALFVLPSIPQYMTGEELPATNLQWCARC
jgi:hypothetical protein